MNLLLSESNKIFLINSLIMFQLASPLIIDNASSCLKCGFTSYDQPQFFKDKSNIHDSNVKIIEHEYIREGKVTNIDMLNQSYD